MGFEGWREFSSRRLVEGEAQDVHRVREGSVNLIVKHPNNIARITMTNRVNK